jgi:hypothetical protein
MTKRELAETLILGVPKDELDAIIELLASRDRKPANLRPSVVLDRYGNRTLTAQEFDEFLVEYGPYMGAPDGEG